MPEEHKLASARAHLALSQKELGKQIASRTTGRDITDKYAQKKVSYWESGQARPSLAEVAALSEILKKPADEIEGWFPKLPSSAADLFTQLAQSEHPSLISACYSGKPRAAFDRDVLDSLVEGLSGKVALAMYFPFPSAFDQSITGEGAEDLYDIYKEIWRSVRSHYEDLFAKCPSAKRETNLALYRPDLCGNKANVLIPPASSRYTLIVQYSSPDQYTKTLYIWVESQEIEGLYRVGTFSVQEAQPQLVAWQAYFGGAVRHWMANLSLPGSVAPWAKFVE